MNQYNNFRKLAIESKNSFTEKIGFSQEARDRFEEAILADIVAKLSLDTGPKIVLDIGCGCGELTERLIELCSTKGHGLVLVDSPEMLSYIKDRDFLHKVPGFFPRNLDQVHKISQKFDCILTYSVLQYIFLDTNLYCFIDTIMSLLKEGGRALIGDIPNVSMRKRFLSSQAGINYHKRFMKSYEDPIINKYEIEKDLIDDAVLFGIMQRVRHAGFQSYLLPLAENLYYSNRREDLLITKF
jgi:cyclopropane fatty-acyl-phospholipid synthase-like methyltransferase